MIILEYIFEDMPCDVYVDVDKTRTIKQDVDYLFEVEPTEEDFIEYGGKNYDKDMLLDDEDFMAFLKDKYRDTAYNECKERL